MLDWQPEKFNWQDGPRPLLHGLSLDDADPISVDMDFLRERLRAKALESTFFLGKFVLGFKDLTIRTHGPMCKFIEAPSKRKLGLAPRDHLKTTVWTITDTLRRICQRPSIRILLGNETATNAAKWVRMLESVFEKNALFQWLFPDLIPDFAKVKKWSETEMLVPRDVDFPESTVESIGVGGAVVSRHFDLLKLDDLVGKEASESEEVMRKTIDWYIYCESLLVHPRESEIHNYGTRWAYRDLHEWAQTHEAGAELFYRGAILDTGDALWPERFDLSELDRIRAKLGSFKFSCQYLNKPFDPERTSMREEWLRFYTLKGEMCIFDGQGAEGSAIPSAESTTSVDEQAQMPAAAVSFKDMRRFLRIDPAISEDDRACDSAIVVDGVDAWNRKVVLDTWARKCHPSEMIKAVFELLERWDPESVAIEVVAFQRFLKFFIEQEMQRRGLYVRVIPLKTDTHKSKRSRIRGVQPYFERGEIYVQKAHTKLIDQYLQFPTGDDMDVLDAFAYGPQVWEMPDVDGEAADDDEEEKVGLEFTMGGRSAYTGY